MTALPRLQAALDDAAANPRRPRRAVVPLAVAGAATVALAVGIIGSGPEAEREVAVPATGAPVVARAVDPPTPAPGRLRGLVELRATDPRDGSTILGAYYQDGNDDCLMIASDPSAQRPIGPGGSCVRGSPGEMPQPLSYGVGADSPQSPRIVSGRARDDITSLVIDGPGGRHTVPISRHRGWFAVYPPDAEGPITFTLTMADGSTEKIRMRIDLRGP